LKPVQPDFKQKNTKILNLNKEAAPSERKIV